MTIPQSDNLSTARMNRIFANTTATYKFYWFIGILDLYIRTGKTRFNVWDIMIEMVVNAWYPVCYFHLSFGKSESLYDAILELQDTYSLPINISKRDLNLWLHENIENKEVAGIISFLQNKVPYRFLSPWIRTDNDKELTLRSQSFENGCPYRLVKENATMWIDLNGEWLDYLQTNYAILRDYAYWNLTLFLQARNPNVPNIPNKLIKSETRNSLTNQHHYWDFVMNHGLKINCIYTNNPLSAGNYDLDHFIPWSFVSHDLVWNLMPADGSINSSKSNKLPNLDIYLPKLAIAQQQAVKVCLANHYRGKKILEDYLSLGFTPQELADMDTEHLNDCFMRTYSPLNQIALNMGFETWNYE